MRAHLFAIAVAALSAAPALAADAPNAPVTKASGQPDPVLVAAADPLAPPVAQNAPPAEQQQAPSPDKPVRHARVTTCRCGDQTPSN